jgi:peptidoglycan/LPS O-acetylase OafA/YrhL
LPENAPQLLRPKYRADIDGLRAVAVLAVVGFHAFPGIFAGGFVGVDIFFVISGFLISTILFENFAAGRFSFIEFYRRRIRRIFPALTIVLAASLAIGWFTLLADEYQQLGKHVAAGAGFVSNIVLWNESGYFDSAASLKPLLHLWSLGVEEQFYLLFPLLLWIGWRARANLLGVSVGVAIVSFALNLVALQRDPVGDFYSPGTRFWELMIGAILAYRMTKSPAETNGAAWRSTAGMLLIGAGVVGTRGQTRFPGWWALLPTLGTAALIAAGPQGWFNRVVLRRPSLVALGLISYPLYLWHHVLLTFARITYAAVPAPAFRIGLVALSVVLAWLTYKLIEQPFRFGHRVHARTAIPLAGMMVVGVLGYGVLSGGGLPGRAFAVKFDAYAKTAISTPREKDCFDIPYAHNTTGDWYCRLGDASGQPQIFAFGDSHALSLVPVLERYGRESRAGILFTAGSGCAPLLGVQSVRDPVAMQRLDCRALHQRVFDYVRANSIRTVLLIARWTLYTGDDTGELNPLTTDNATTVTIESSRRTFETAVRNTVAAYHQIGTRVVLFEDSPQQPLSPRDALRRSSLSDESINTFAVPLSAHLAAQRWTSGVLSSHAGNGTIVLNFDDVLCDNRVCPFAKNGGLLYFDDDHLSVDGALLLYPSLSRGLSGRP